MSEIKFKNDCNEGDEKKSLLKEIKSDLYRNGLGISKKAFVLAYKRNRLFRFMVWFRIARYFQFKGTYVVKPLTRWFYHHLCIKYSIDIPLAVKIGYGLKIVHGMGLVVNSNAIIGNNVMLSHGVTLAIEKGGSPQIGDRVRISPGVVIVGNVRIGDDCVIGANCVVIKDVPDKSTAVGVPNRNIANSYNEFTEQYYYKFD
jgi:serine O-acetyltransferase